MGSLIDERVRKFSGITDAIKEKNGDIVIVVNHVDPDSVGAAFGCKEILNFLGCENVEMTYSGTISHPQNKEIFNQFGLYDSFCNVESFHCDKEATFIWLDSSRIEDSRLPDQYAKIIPTIVIDHHRGEDLPDEGQDYFFWVEDIGSTSTLICELGQKLEVAFSKGARTLLALGIHNDTKSLIKASNRDIGAFDYLKGDDISADLNALNSFELPPSFFEIFLHALASKDVQNENMIANAGILGSEDGDFLSIIADQMILERGRSLVVVWGVIGNKVRIAARSKGSGISLNELLKDKFGKENAGAKFTPDKRGEGGALLSIGFLHPTKDKVVQKEILAAISALLKNKLFSEDE
ncbi:bifunctional oligoribonuclease/PAP phosphatase NrnA [Patescibacteria group bacterium]